MLSPLAQRLAHAARSPGVEWRILAENIPVWPSPPSISTHSRWTGVDDSYAPSQGEDVLLSALCARARGQGADVDTDSVIVTNGGFDALGLTARLLKRAGIRRAVCAGPVLRSVANLFRLVGLDLVVEDWSVLLSGYGRTSVGLGPTDLVYVNTPHNPTGACADEPELRSLLSDQRCLGFQLVFDLVYDSFVYDAGKAVSPLGLIEDWRGVYAVNSFSKNYGAPGLRVGWAIAESDAVEQLTTRLEIERIAVSSAAQLCAAELCGYDTTPLVERVGVGRELTLDWARKVDIPIAVTDGGTQAWLDLRVDDSEKFADVLMEEDRLIVTTGVNYFPHHPGHIRVPLGIDPDLLEASLEQIAWRRNEYDATSSWSAEAASFGDYRELARVDAIPGGTCTPYPEEPGKIR